MSARVQASELEKEMFAFLSFLLYCVVRFQKNKNNKTTNNNL